MSSKSTKYLYAFLMVMILLILPYTTWYALQKGEAYLIDTVEDIKIAKDSLDNFSFVYVDGTRKDTITKEQFEGQVILFFNHSNYELLKPNLIEFDKQMSKADNLQFVQLYGVNEAVPNDLTTDLKVPIRNMMDLNDLSSRFEDNKLIGIVDTKGMLRTSYDETKEDFIMIVKHLALLLPKIERGR